MEARLGARAGDGAGRNWPPLRPRECLATCGTIAHTLLAGDEGEGRVGRRDSPSHTHPHPCLSWTVARLLHVLREAHGPPR
jgi:hypothetical protein